VSEPKDRLIDPRDADGRAELEAALYDQAAWNQFSANGFIDPDERRETRRDMISTAALLGIQVRDDADLTFIHPEDGPVKIEWCTGLVSTNVVMLDVPGEGRLLDYLSA